MQALERLHQMDGLSAELVGLIDELRAEMEGSDARVA